MLRLSILIPVLGKLKRLEDTLVSVLENRPADCEVVVVLNQPYDDPYDLKGEVRFVEARARAGLAECINQGILATEAPFVHLLTAGVEVSAGWADLALPHFRNPEVAAVVPIVLDKTGTDRIVSAGIAYWSGGTVTRLGAGKQVGNFTLPQTALCGADTLAAFYRRSALELVGRLAEDVGDTVVGADLALALRHAGFRAVAEPLCRAEVDLALLHQRGALRQGREAERLFWKWAPARGWLRSLARHAGLLSRECILWPVRPAILARLAGRMLEALRFASHREHWRRLRQTGGPIVQTVGPPHFVTSDCRTPVESHP